MAISPEQLETSTKIIVSSLDRNETLKKSMRGGLLYLSNALEADMPNWLALDDDEKGMAQLDNIQVLSLGWLFIAKKLDYNGRVFLDTVTPTDTARMHFTLAQAHALGVHVTGERNESDISHLAYMLGEYVMLVTESEN